MGTSKTTTTINDTRIYQENIDGAYAPTSVSDLKLYYSSAITNNTAILRATKGSYTLDSLDITGQHAGWTGNGGVYMALTVSDGTNPINANLTLTRSTISVTGQVGTASFLQSWNNNGTVMIGDSGAGNTFNETGYSRGSFHFASMYANGVQGPKRGNYTVTNNTFIGDGTYRLNSNRLENVVATVNNNMFKSGSYLDLAGTLNQTTLAGNTFESIADAPSIRFTQKSSSLALLNSTGLTLNSNKFSGYGLAIVNNDVGIFTSSVVKVSGTFNDVYAGPIGGADTIGPKTIDNFCAGGRFADTITGNDGADWISGGGGADTIDGGDGADWIIGGADSDTITTGLKADTVFYYNPNEGSDTITDFTTGSGAANNDKLAFMSSAFGGITNSTFITNTNFISGSSPSAPNAVPTFLYDTSNGQLIYDSNGSAAGGTSLIATLNGIPALTTSSFSFF
jgi:Ca2+-binding RTX toxin-like protein